MEKEKAENNKVEVTKDKASTLEKIYRELKIKLQDLERWKKSKPLYLLVLVCCVLLACGLYYSRVNFIYPHKFSALAVVVTITLGILAGCAIGMAIYMCFELLEHEVQRNILGYESDNLQTKVEADIFENSIKMSYKYLDQYYLQTREQAQRGFFVTVGVAIFGAILIFVGVAAMFFEKVEPSYITCASGVITEFIAAIFFYLYNKTVSSMSKYHNKLVLSQNISIALKIADSLPPEDKAKTKNLIITELLKDINAHLVKNDFSNTSDK